MSWKLPRPVARKVAEITGYFFLPCHLCGQEFAGFEWRTEGPHEGSTPDLPYTGKATGICPDCTARGLGCRAWAEAGLPLQAHDCEFVRGGVSGG